MKKFNSRGIIAFTVYHDHPTDPSWDELLGGLLVRIAGLVKQRANGTMSPEEHLEVFAVEDTVEND